MRLFADAKGRYAETVIENLFNRVLNRFKVYKTGIEHSFAEVVNDITNFQMPYSVIAPFSTIPDLLIARKRSGKDFKKGQSLSYAVYAEIKYRQDSTISYEELRQYQKYAAASNAKDKHDLVFLLFSGKGVFCLDIRDLDKTVRMKGKYKRIHFEDCLYLSEHPIWNFTKEQKRVVEVFEQQTGQILKGLPTNANMGRTLDDALDL